MTKRTKKQKFSDFFDAFKCVQNGEVVKRSSAKDGSIPTHPVVPCPVVSEHIVQANCIARLKCYRVFGNRSNVGTGTLVSKDKAGFTSSSGTYRRYGIVGAGDWIGLLPNGIHIEIEFKAGKGGRLSAVQQERKAAIEKNKGIFLIVHGVPELEYYMSPILKGITDA